MPHSAPSALISDRGNRVLLRLAGRFYDLGQQELRAVLGLPGGPPGLGISIDRNRFRFEFVEDNQTVELTAAQLQRRIAKVATNKV
jgi:hypothetical protein